MPFSHLPTPWVQWLPALACLLDPRSARRFVSLLLGAALAAGRRTVTAWLRAVGLSAQFRPAYTALAAAGRRTDSLAALLAHRVLRPLLGGTDRLLLALDDTPTERYGPKVQGAGVHHNPTPGPARRAFVYGHCWVVLAWVGGHLRWGTLDHPAERTRPWRGQNVPAGRVVLRRLRRCRDDLADRR